MHVLSHQFLMSTMLTNPKQNKVRQNKVKQWVNYPKAPRNTDATSLDHSSCVRFLLVASGWELLSKVWNRSNFWTNNSQHFFYSVLAEGLRNNVGSVCTALPTLGSFSIDDGNGSKNVAFAKNSRFSNTVAFIPICWKWQMWANFPRVDFLKSALNFIERKRNSSSLVYVLHKTSNRPFYSYGWKRGWRWPCFDTNLSALLCK